MLKKIVAYLISTLVCAVCYLPAQITYGTALFEHLTIENGLSSNETTCLYQDSRGFIWLGTANGLNRYDGVQLLQLHHQPNNPNSLPGNYIASIAEDKQHNLWIGTNEGVSRYNATKNIYTNYLHTLADYKTLSDSRYFVFIDREGAIWVASKFHISLLNTETGKAEHFPVDAGQHKTITRNYWIKTPFEDNKNRFWLATSYGVVLFNKKTKKAKYYRFPETDKAVPENAVNAIAQTPGGKIIAGTWGGGILIYNETADVFEKMEIDASMPDGTSASYRNMLFDFAFHQNKMYAATAQGVLVINEEDLIPGRCTRFINYRNEPANNKSLATNTINALMVDKQQTIWVATSTGIDKIDQAKQIFQTTLLPKRHGISIQISSIVFQDNKMLLAANDAYWWHKGKLSALGYTPKMFYPGYLPQAWDLAAGKNHHWMATNKGLLQLTKDGVLVKQYLYEANNEKTIAGERIWTVYEDRKGFVWMGTVRKGISILNPATGEVKRFYTKPGEPHSLFNKYISPFFESKNGDIWFAAGPDELFRYQQTSQKFILYTLALEGKKPFSRQPLPFFEDDNGLIWIGSERGILLFNPATSQTTMKCYDAAMQSLKHILKDGNNIWMVCDGLVKYSISNNKFQRFTTANGLYSNSDIDVLKIAPTGELVLAGPDYITFYKEPLSAEQNNNLPVVFTKIVANGKDSLYQDKQNKLSYLSGIEFDFAALNFSNAAENHYKYRLIGIDKNWSQPGLQRSVSYAQLPPGKYTFEVMGSNNEGVWSKNIASFTFSVKRPFYKTIWFYLLLALITGFIIYSFYRYRLRKAIELEKMRTRIATDLHDDIGATLSSISMYSDALKKQMKDTMPHLEPVLDKMGQSSREMVTGMSDIVWAINPKNDSGEKLLQRMENYATDICALRNISFHFKYDEKIKEQTLPLEIRKNTYLIFKEAVNNAVKYAEAENIWVSINYSGALVLQVKDDGKGFNEMEIKKGNGLKNFAIRAEEAGGKLEIKSAPGNGVEINFLCNV